MMRILFICLLLFASLTKAQKTSLSHSVNQARTQGKVLSAKTKNGQHIVKILTPDGRIKTIKKSAYSVDAQNPRYPNHLRPVDRNHSEMDKRSRANRKSRNANMSNRSGSQRFDSRQKTQNRNTNNKSKDDGGRKKN